MADDGIQFTAEEQEYLRMETGQTPVEAEPPPQEEEAPAEEAQAEESAPAEEEKAEDKPAEEPEEQKADDAEAEDEEDKEEEPAPRKQTPIDTIRALRAERRELRKELKERREVEQKAQERLDQLADAVRKLQAPDPNIDPEGYEQYQAKVKQEEEQRTHQTEQQKQIEQQQKELYQYVVAQEQEFSGQQGDYFDVVREGKDLAIENKAAEYMALDVDEQAALDLAEEEVERYLEGKAANLKRFNGNFAKWMYNECKKVIDFKKKSGQGDEASAEEKEKPAPDPKKAESELRALNEGKRASRTPRGSTGGKNLTIQELAARDDIDDFLKVASDHKKLRELFGE